MLSFHITSICVLRSLIKIFLIVSVVFFSGGLVVSLSNQVTVRPSE